METSYLYLITKRIEEYKSDEVFIASDFLDIADYETVRKTLNRLTERGVIRKIDRGLYYNPKFSKLLNEYEAPSPHNVALALSRKFNWNIAPSGNTALNMLGISTQVSAHWTYISDGPYNDFSIGNIVIEFKHRNNKEISGMSFKSALVIQALKAIGKDNINDSTINIIRNQLDLGEKKLLMNEGKRTTAWIYPIIQKICEVA